MIKLEGIFKMSDQSKQEQDDSSEQQTPADANESGEQIKSTGQCNDLNNIDEECENLLKNTKKQVKQMMEEAVTRKFIHEESSSIIALCVAVDNCLSHGLKRRALGLFKTNSSTALIQKVAKTCKSAQEVLQMVDSEERRQASESQRTWSAITSVSSPSGTDQLINLGAAKQILKQVASNSLVHKRNLWIKYSLIEKKLVEIVEYLAENSTKYYEPEALMANYLCSQILCSLLVGPSALEFSRTKSSDYYQFDDPSATELLKRHKLANPIACLCQQSQSGPKALKLSQSVNNSGAQPASKSARDNAQLSTTSTSVDSSLKHSSRANELAMNSNQAHRSTASTGESPSEPQQAAQVRKESRRRPLALKTANVKRGTLITDCHHYSCQEISEHHSTRGYSFLCASSNCLAPVMVHQQNGQLSSSSGCSPSSGSMSNNNNNNQSQQSQHQIWSPRMLHETLHQNSRSNLLYAKNNVLLETQPQETIAGYLSLHQIGTDLILKWIPNQMINGSQVNSASEQEDCEAPDVSGQQRAAAEPDSDLQPEEESGRSSADASARKLEQPVAIESSCLDLVMNLPISRIVLLHCQFGGCQLLNDSQRPEEPPKSPQKQVEALECNQGPGVNQRVQSTEETLILVEADGVQLAPFKFPKGGLRAFLTCLESGLHPDKYLDPAIKFDEDTCPDPLELEHSSLLRGELTSDSPGGLDSPLMGEHTRHHSASSRLDSFLNRWPSLKRRPRKINETNQAQRSVFESSPPNGVFESRTESPVDESQLVVSGSANQRAPHLPTNNYVYRIVSHNQADWPLQTPPHSAPSSGSLAAAQSQHQRQQQAGTGPQSASSALKFRWSFGKLARFSSRYTNSIGGSTTSSNTTGNSLCPNGLDKAANGMENGSAFENTLSLGELENDTEGDPSGQPQTKLTSSVGDHESPEELIKRERSRQLARMEAKLRHLNESNGNYLQLLRTQSIQTLCESMRKQIVARAFYGWLIHCRKTKIVRAHLVKLVIEDSWLVEEEEEEESCESIERLRNGLTRERWLSLRENEANLSERELSRQCNRLVYYGGIESNELRREVWPYLLGHYEFLDSQVRCRARDECIREAYENCGCEWIKIERVVKQRDSELLAANMAKARRAGKGSRTISETSDDSLSLASARASANNKNDYDNEDHNGGRAVGSEVIDEGEIYHGDEAGQQFDSLQEQPVAGSGNDDEEDDENNNNEKAREKEEKMRDDGRGNKLRAGEQQPKLEVDSNEQPTETRPTPKLDSIKGRQIGTNGPRATGGKAARRRRRPRLESTGSVGSDASITDQFGNNVHRIDKDVQRCDRNFWYFKEAKNLDKLRNIMCSYVWQHLDIGYVQGMCDLAAPFLVIFDDEILAFSCFSQLMKRMVANFPHGCAMDQHFESLKYLMQVLDPKLYEILQCNGDYTHFYFCYRWLLLDFKRELAYEDVYRVWETIWSARHVATDHFVVFMALAMVRYYRDIIIENNMDFTDTIKFFNEMAERHDVLRIIVLARDCVFELKTLIKAADQSVHDNYATQIDPESSQ